MRNAKIRFTDRVVDYQRYRPCYPDALTALLRDDIHLAPATPVADVGSGTGIFTRQLLNTGYDVFAIEPNHAMRSAAESLLSDYEAFHSIAGSAEDTTLPDRQVDLVTATQSFHWFDLEPARIEFMRITRPPHRVMLAWNHRLEATDGFNSAYESFLHRWCDEYAQILEISQNRDRVERFYGRSQNYQLYRFENGQSLNWDALQGRIKSCSYVPGVQDPRHIPMLCDLRLIFDQYESQGRVALLYDTQVYLGTLE
jgi:SAM-dependent methyltransferase